MYGGLKKSASRLALVAAAGVMSTNAFAADLGGDCCADLEERVAELEATTARKGTRKTSLEIWGDVNREIIAYNDGVSKNVFLGTDNVNYSTRFGLRGNAKITPTFSAGYSIVIEQNTGARSTNVAQNSDKNGLGLGGAIGAAGSAINNTSNGAVTYTNDAGVSMREANWWIESKNVGRLTVGRFINGALAGPTGMIDLADIGNGAAGASSVNGGGLFVRNNNPSNATIVPGAGNITKYTLSNMTDSFGEYGTRENGVAYTSPTFAGFSFGASLAGAAQQSDSCANFAGGVCVAPYGFGPTWSVVGKYAGEFNGLRIAASAGYEDSKNETQTSINTINTGAPTGGQSNSPAYRPDSINKGIALSLLHVPTGLFITGMDNWYTRGHDLLTQGGVATGTTSDTANQIWLQAGITKNWFGVGNTTPYAEWQRTTNGFNTFGLEGKQGDVGLLVGSSIGGGTYAGDKTTLTMWGVGLSQKFDAAALELYTGYRSYQTSSDNCTANGGCKDISLFVAGGRIKF